MQSKWAGVLPQPHLDLAGGIALWRPAGPSSGSANSSWKLFRDQSMQGTTGQNRTKQTRAQKQAKQTKTNKALFTEQAADFGMWQQSWAAYAGKKANTCYNGVNKSLILLSIAMARHSKPSASTNTHVYAHGRRKRRKI